MYTLNKITRETIADMLRNNEGTVIKHKGISFPNLHNAVTEFGDGTKTVYPNVPGTDLFQEFGAESSVIVLVSTK